MSKPLNELIPDDVLHEALMQKCCELEPGFLCFDENYTPVADIIPKSYIIVDLGCYMAAQAYLFRENEAYIGVDSYDMPECFDIWYAPPERFLTENSTHFAMSIESFINDFLPGLGIGVDKMYAICSAVPSKTARELVLKTFPNAFVAYPGMPMVAQGVNKDAIRNRAEELLQKKVEEERQRVAKIYAAKPYV